MKAARRLHRNDCGMMRGGGGARELGDVGHLGRHEASVGDGVGELDPGDEHGEEDAHDEGAVDVPQQQQPCSRRGRWVRPECMTPRGVLFNAKCWEVPPAGCCR
jgi:hypothetical protein